MRMMEKREKALRGIICCLPVQHGGAGCAECPYGYTDIEGEPECADTVLLPVAIIEDVREVHTMDLTHPDEERTVNPVEAALTLVKLLALIGVFALLLIAIVCGGLGMVSWLMRTIFGG